MVKLVCEDINSFVRNQDPAKLLGLGYKAKIHAFFKLYHIPEYDYEIKEDGKIVFNTRLLLSYEDITELPDNLTIYDTLDISDTKITSLSDNLYVKDFIVVEDIQTELIRWIKQSKFKNKLKIW